ncbi:hypothetical protein C8R47DRAFT_1090275 [Mycena vitilis]|nr:hypothetical protein C8R47DRAFT_1090275 [Mycena vitilis]
MAFVTPLSQLRISPTSPGTTIPFTMSANFEDFYDPIEYGMGFNRGELDEFVKSTANLLEVPEDVLEALESGDWVLSPEEEHVRSITRLWSNNSKCTTLEERTRYPPSQDNSVDGVARYTYRLWHVPSLRMVGPNEQRLESGTAHVSSSIPPYLWVVYASVFVSNHRRQLPARLSRALTTLYLRLTESPLPRAFLTLELDHERPKFLCKEEVEEREEARHRRFWATVRRRLTPDQNGQLTAGQKRLEQHMIELLREIG